MIEEDVKLNSETLHVRYECEGREVECPDCNNILIARQLPLHLETECPLQLGKHWIHRVPRTSIESVVVQESKERPRCFD